MHVVTFSFLSLSAFFTASQPPLVVSGQSDSGITVELKFSEAIVTTQTKTATVCALPATITDVVLWMPDMGHGSSPTHLTQRTDGCVDVSKMAFFMRGAWEVRVILNDGSHAALPVVVE